MTFYKFIGKNQAQSNNSISSDFRVELKCDFRNEPNDKRSTRDIQEANIK